MTIEQAKNELAELMPKYEGAWLVVKAADDNLKAVSQPWLKLNARKNLLESFIAIQEIEAAQGGQS